MAKNNKKSNNANSLEEKTCFFIAPIGDAGSEVRLHSDNMRFVVEQALSDMGFVVQRADDISEGGMITRQIIDRIVKAKLVVADMTGGNPNVYYEMAVRHVSRKPIIHIIREGETPPFDNKDVRPVFVNLKRLESINTAVENIAEQAHQVLDPKWEAANPIVDSLDINALRGRELPDGDILPRLLSEVSDIKSSIAWLTGKVRESSTVAVRGMTTQEMLQECLRNDMVYGDVEPIAGDTSPIYEVPTRGRVIRR